MSIIANILRVGSPESSSALHLERERLRKQRDEAQQAAYIARSKFLEALSKAVVDDVRHRPAH